MREFLAYLRRMGYIAALEGDDTVRVKIDGLSDDEARADVELYLSLWRARHPDAHATVLH